MIKTSPKIVTLKTDSTIDQTIPTTGFKTLFIPTIPSGVTLTIAFDTFKDSGMTAQANDTILLGDVESVRITTTGTSAGGTIPILFTPIILYRNRVDSTVVVQATNLVFRQNSTFTTSQVSVLVTATQIVASNTSRNAIIIINTDTVNPIYLGSSSSVTASTGHKLPAGGSITLDRNSSAIYGIATGGTVVVTALEE